jgi:hypothetical protein
MACPKARKVEEKPVLFLYATKQGNPELNGGISKGHAGDRGCFSEKTLKGSEQSRTIRGRSCSMIQAIFYMEALNLS